MASLTIAYVLWLFGGLFGLHHVYLRRERQAFIWWVTWGGMILGWLGEVGRIREYVDEANREEEYVNRMTEIRKKNPTPEFNFALIAGQFMIGHQLANLLISAVPDMYIEGTVYGPYLTHLLAALGASIGVNLVANIGAEQAPFLSPFLISCLTTPLAFFLADKPRPFTILLCTVISAYFSSEQASWRDMTPNTNLGYKDTAQRLGVLFLALTTYSGLWSSNLYFNFKITMLNGTQVTLKDTVYNFAQTQPWQEARKVMDDMYPCLRMYGWEPFQRHLLTTLADISDPQRDEWALKILGFSDQPTPKMIHSHCRKLSSKFHPDRFSQSDESEKEAATKKFVEIQRACGILDVIKTDRERRSKWSISETEQSETVRDEEDDTIGEHDTAMELDNERIDTPEDHCDEYADGCEDCKCDDNVENGDYNSDYTDVVLDDNEFIDVDEHILDNGNHNEVIGDHTSSGKLGSTDEL